MNCRKCGKEVSAERVELGLETCLACAPRTKPKGVLEFAHKTAGWLVMVEPEEFDRLREAEQALETGRKATE